MGRRRRWLLLALCFSVAALAQSQPSGANWMSLVGRWELNLGRSSWGAIPPPKSATIDVLSYDGQAMRWTASATDENGNSIGVNWQGPLNGSAVIADDSNDSGVSYAFQPEPNGIHETARFPDGAVIQSVVTLSADGRTLTLRRHMTSPTRGQADWTEVYDRAQ